MYFFVFSHPSVTKCNEKQSDDDNHDDDDDDDDNNYYYLVFNHATRVQFPMRKPWGWCLDLLVVPLLLLKIDIPNLQFMYIN